MVLSKPINMKKALLFFVSFTILLTVVGCKKNEILKQQEFSIADRTSEECETIIDLIAGQHYDAGEVIISNDAEFIYVTFATSENWFLSETHLFVGQIEDLPLTPLGNPKIGRFPYSSTHELATSFTYTIPIDESLDCYVIAAHATVNNYVNGTLIQSETAWGEGQQISNTGSWAMQSEYCLMNCCEYSIESFPIYGGQTIEAGHLDVTNDEDSLYITFVLENGWSTATTHLYVGNLEDLPTNPANIPIPGQFPYSITNTFPLTEIHYSIPLNELGECYIIAAHSELTLLESGDLIQQETGWSFGTPFPESNRWGWYSEYCTQSCE